MINKEKEKQQNINEEAEVKADESTQENIVETDNFAEAGEVKTDTASIDESQKKTKTEAAEQKDDKEDDMLKKTDPKDLQIKELEEKNKELNEKYLRLFSEFDNFRKRNIKEKLELTKTASAEITEAILPILDDLERAYKSAIENPDIEALTEGINLIQTKLKTTLRHKGLEVIPTIGEDFNTDFHEAITNIPAKEEKEKGKVVDEVQKGYLLNGKILRFAKVVVAN